MGQVLANSNVVGYPATADLIDPHGELNSAVGTADAWPATVLAAFDPGVNRQSAEAYTWQLAHSHYENFSVVSALLPRRLRQDFCNIYAFCRIADDLADEVADQDQSIRFLNRFRQQTLRMFAGNADTVVFKALESTVEKYNIPIQPFLDLIDAFEQDQRIDRYETYDQLLDYCRRSANPVGRLVLHVSGYSDTQRQKLSDATCTALQLANFWQDVRRDITDRNRIYLPRETMEQFQVTEAQLLSGSCDQHYRNCIQFEVDRTQSLFDRGDLLLPLVDETVRPQISLFGQGGKAILNAIRRSDYDTLSTRPSLSRWQKGQLILRAMAGRLMQVVQT